MEDITNKSNPKTWLIFLFIFIAIFLWIMNLLLVPVFFPVYEDRGLFGDMFGSANALFSGLAFAGLLYAIYLQGVEIKLARRDLALQREEMEKSREELKGQRNQLEQQNITLHIRSFENSYYNLINHYIKRVELLKREHGNDILTTTYKVFMTDLKDNLTNSSAGEQRLDEVQKIVNNAFEKIQYAIIGHFVLIEKILAYIITNTHERNYDFYTTIFGSLISQNELMLLFYFGLNTDEACIRPSVTKLSFFRFIDTSKMEFKDHIFFYDKKAFTRL